MFKVTARTVLELGAELISSDIIAFYELVKNAFDAGSKTGVDIRFLIPLRRNHYLRVRAKAEALDDVQDQADQVKNLIEELQSRLDHSAGLEITQSFVDFIGRPKTVRRFLEKLDEAYRSKNTIEVMDRGSGMSLSDLKDNYLTIGTPSRKREVERAAASGSPKSPFLGEKGIGRLSAMRLGERLLIETAKQSDVSLNILDIDWRRFDRLDAMVEDVDIEPRLGDKKASQDWSGTKLTISDLSEDWTDTRVRGIAEYDFARLTDPFRDPKNRQRVAIFWNGSRVAIPWMDRVLLEHAHASFKGNYRIENGEPLLSVALDAVNLGFPHPHEVDFATLSLPDLEGAIVGTSQEVPISALSTVGPFEFEVYWYNRRHLAGIDSIGNQRAVRELQRKWSGIMLFRDGFRVFPYGDDDDDWLGLDRKALGRPGYALNKAQFVGRVLIGRMSNPKLVDQTNREGLRATPEQQAFVGILQHIIQGLLWDFLRDVERRHKRQPIDLGDVKAEVNQLESRARAALSRVKKYVPKEEAEVVEDLQLAFNEFQDLTSRAQKRIEEVEADSRQMVHMAGVGLMVEVIAHELARAVESALGAVESLAGKNLPVEVKARLDTLRAEMKTVSKRLRVLDELSVSGRHRSEVFDLGDLINDLKEGHSAQFTRHKINFKVEKPRESLRIHAVKGMVVQILENLISNSVYWTDIRAARESRYEPTITIRIEANPFTLYYRDNGRGIAAENKEKIFRPFWSLKEKGKRRGLGLFIARENANYMGGSLVLADDADPHTKRLHKFVLEFPEAATVK